LSSTAIQSASRETIVRQPDPQKLLGLVFIFIGIAKQLAIAAPILPANFSEDEIDRFRFAFRDARELAGQDFGQFAFLLQRAPWKPIDPYERHCALSLPLQRKLTWITRSALDFKGKAGWLVKLFFGFAQLSA
jgi:hypothetical protein